MNNEKKYINGKFIRNSILDEIKIEFNELEKKRKKQAKLSVFVVGENKATNAFVKKKRQVAEKLNIIFDEHRFLKEEVTTEKIIKEIEKISDETDGIIVQLPLPKTINTRKILNSVPIFLDVDLLNEKSLDFFLDKIKENIFILPPVPMAVYEILNSKKFEFKNKNIVLNGFGKLVGYPLGMFFNKMAIKYKIVNSTTSNPIGLYKKADLIISGVGKPNMVQPEMLKNNVFLIDAGTSTANQKIVGDISLDCVKKASFFSKTPGGVGPITVALIYKNLLSLIKMKENI